MNDLETAFKAGWEMSSTAGAEDDWQDAFAFWSLSDNAAPSAEPSIMQTNAREIIARFLAEKTARSPMSGRLTADDYMSYGGMHEQADELMKRLAALSAPKAPRDCGLSGGPLMEASDCIGSAYTHGRK